MKTKNEAYVNDPSEECNLNEDSPKKGCLNIEEQINLFAELIVDQLLIELNERK
jgi:hypothetical protein